ncbi:U-scoloptoxin(05)-Er3a-like [Tubulanus polymorphus]|uniref:U-scoloptoxin(05)-Er3a-like n=1 Tax=Tubulanus polymorphus TaxID=672921 RepID=UPI003DA23800
MDRIWTYILFIVVSVVFLIVTTEAILCSQCDSKKDISCQLNPPMPTNCTEENQFCIVIEEKDENDTLLSVSRGCSPLSMSTDCLPGTGPENRALTLCYISCQEDGCNEANYSRGQYTVIAAATSIAVYLIQRILAISD